MEKYIISANKEGLCNRLKCLISSMRIAEAFSKTLILFWPKNSICNCIFFDLFENKITEIDQEELERLTHKENKDKKYEVYSTWRLLPLSEDKLPSNFARVFPSENGNDIDFEYERIPLSVRGEFLRYINRLIPKKYIIEEVEKFSSYFNDDTISIHIRSWKTKVDDIEKDQFKLLDIRYVYKIMDKAKNHNFFVACDSLKILEKIINRYKKRVLYYPKRTFPGDRRSIEEIQDALIELLLLSKNKYLKASHLSTYSEMAWWFGGCKARVETIPPTPAGMLSLIKYRIKTKIRKHFFSSAPIYKKLKS